jgi:type II secretory pathway component PulJ
MTLSTELYSASRHFLPVDGQHIVAHQTETQVVVYQAYNQAIAQFAVENQYLGGPSFSYGRMSWIKPNFLWMMYRCGWACKENQERVLALWLTKAAFEEILSQAVFSSFRAGDYASEEAWKHELTTKNVRLQWDPDHSPYGDKLTRRALQLGLKNEALEQFGKHQVTRIEDVTDFVQQQKIHVDNRQLEHLHIPQERVYAVTNAALARHIGLSSLAT